MLNVSALYWYELLLHINVIIVIIYKISTYRNKAYFIKRIYRQHRKCQMIYWYNEKCIGQEKTSKVKIDIFNLSKKFILIKVIKILFNIQLKSQRKKQELHVHSIYNYIINIFMTLCASRQDTLTWFNECRPLNP